MQIIGHKKIIDSLGRAIERNCLAHSYLFCGPESVGKFLVARDFADKLTGRQKESFNQNLLIIEPEVEEKDGVFKEKEIKIDAIKNLQKEFSLTSFDLSPVVETRLIASLRNDRNYRVAIIRSAQKMNVSAQNALLKILEEPPENTVIILVAEDEKKILPTIVSRCQIKNFKLLSSSEIGEILSLSLPNREEIIFWSLGRPGFAQKFLQKEDELEKKREIVKEFQSLFSMSANDKLFLAENLSKNTPQLLSRMDLWIVLFRNVILGQKSFVSVSPTKALKLIFEIEKSRNIIKNTNSNVRLVVENLLLEF